MRTLTEARIPLDDWHPEIAAHFYASVGIAPADGSPLDQRRLEFVAYLVVTGQLETEFPRPERVSNLVELQSPALAELKAA